MKAMVPVLGVLMTIGLSGQVRAVDGVTEINQAKALAGGVTPGDSPGFPVAILSTSGSFRLTSNLTVPDVDTTAIILSTTFPVDVTIDLNGFSIIGPVECERVGSDTICSDSGSGSGIKVGTFGVSFAVANGTIRGMGRDAISATFSTARTRIDHVTAVSNARNGFSVLLTQITNSRAELNGQNGISAFEAGGLITGCVLQGNGNFGIESTTGIGIGGNSFYDNTAGPFAGGLEIAPNACGATLCP
jgi:hypothetical protein